MDPSCSDCGHPPSLHWSGRCKVLAFDRIDGAPKDCNCRRVFVDLNDQDCLGLSLDELPFDPTQTVLRRGQAYLPLHPPPHRCSCRTSAREYCLNHGWGGPGNVHVREERLHQEALRLRPDVVITDGPCSILPAKHPALNT